MHLILYIVHSCGLFTSSGLSLDTVLLSLVAVDHHSLSEQRQSEPVTMYVCLESQLRPQWHLYTLLLMAKLKHRLGHALFLLKNRFLALVLPNLNRSG